MKALLRCVFVGSALWDKQQAGRCLPLDLIQLELRARLAFEEVAMLPDSNLSAMEHCILLEGQVVATSWASAKAIYTVLTQY